MNETLDGGTDVGETSGDGNGFDNGQGNSGGSDHWDLHDRNEGPDHLGAKEMVQELHEMSEEFREWMVENDISDPFNDLQERADRASAFFKNGFEKSGLFQRTEPSLRLEGTQYIDLSFFSWQRGFHVTSTTGGNHNPGSAHGKGRAIDVRTRGMTNQQVEEFIRQAELNGIKVRDERERPPGQTVWSGPHLHLSVGERASTDHEFNRPIRDPREQHHVDFRSERDYIRTRDIGQSWRDNGTNVYPLP